MKDKEIGNETLRALTTASPMMAARGGGRQTDDDYYSMFPQNVLLPDPTQSYRTLTLQRKGLLNLPYHQLAKIALDLSPEVNKGLYDWLRFTNPGHVIRDKMSDDPMMSPGIDANKRFIAMLDQYYGSFKSHLDSLWSGIFVTGGAFIELVLTPDKQMPYDLVFNDPLKACFLKEKHHIRGWRYRLTMQTLGGGYKYLDETPLVKYIGFDRLVDNPYGRPIIGPSVHASLTLLLIINILHKVISQQGLTQKDYEVDAQELLELADRNPEIAGDDVAIAHFIEAHLEKISNVIKNKDPDEQFVHMSTVKVNYANNPLTHTSQGQSTLIQDLQRSVVNGMKSITALSNLLDSTTETHIRSQLEYFVSAIQSLQDEMGDVLTTYFNMANQVQGIQSMLEFIFLRQRTADRKADAEIRATETDTIIKKYDAGIIELEQARDEIDNLTNERQVVL